MTDISRFRNYVAEMTRLVERAGADEAAMIAGGTTLLADLIARDDWLPDAFAAPNPDRYRQYLLHCDPLERFSVVSFVWGPGQETPVHDHTVWGLIGVLRGAEIGQRYQLGPGGIVAGAEERLERGAIDVVSPTRGDVHRVANALKDRPSVSIHVYGANIGAVRRHVFDARTGAPKDFISGYSLAVVPNLWDRSKPVA